MSMETRRLQIFSDQRLAARKSEFVDAFGSEQRRKSPDFLERQNLRLWHPLNMGGHAVDAAVVATVCDADPQIGGLSSKRVNKHLRFTAEHAEKKYF